MADARPLVLLAASLAAAGAADSVGLSARTDRTTVTVGDPIRYEVAVTHPGNARATLPSLRGNTGGLEATDHAVRADTASDGRITVTHSLTLRPYRTGTDTLPPQRVEIRTPPDTVATVLRTPATLVTVRPVVVADSGEIADIRDDDRLPRGVPWGLLPLAILVALAVALVRWVRRRRRLRVVPAPVTAPPPTVDPGERALARLRDLEQRPGDARAFAFTLSEILREYLAARYGIDALEATTAELMERLEPLPLPDASRAWIHETAGGLDAMKFAGAPCPLRDALRLLEGARTLVADTAAPAGRDDTASTPNGGPMP